MSSRALRRAQRHEGPIQNGTDPGSQDTKIEESTLATTNSVFALLNQDRDTEDGDEDAGHEDEHHQTGASDKTESTQESSKAKSKKRRKKSKGKKTSTQSPSGFDNLDEIDRALRDLDSDKASTTSPQSLGLQEDFFDKFCKYFAVKTNCLHPEGEMKRLFGGAALGPEQEESESSQQRQRRGWTRADAGHHNRPLGDLARRRNLLIKGREQWPRAQSGGLGMDHLRRDSDEVSFYTFVHSSSYDDTQKQFEACVNSMDENRLLALKQSNPYHISTLLQVADMLKMQGKRSESAGYIERAVFSFGRSLHSTFADRLSQGKARLNFEIRANREFWLASYYHIQNFKSTGLHGTAFEWVKLLISLDPFADPYEFRFSLDQYAVRAGTTEEFLALVKTNIWWDLESTKYPNVEITLALAHFHAGRSRECRSALEAAVAKYPWVFAKLYEKLDIDPIPPCIWGFESSTEYDRLMSALYIHQAADLWNYPEAIAMLIGVLQHLPRPSPEIKDHPVYLDIARHIMILGEPDLIALLPRKFTTLPSTSTDPLPPQETSTLEPCAHVT
ncbi:MAG: hypothetical protein M1814_002913 [Vezdaea aestivalis]|nr:MAG: hypothetical protein M1814_002913 [Vezdaea aestivalis]